MGIRLKNHWQSPIGGFKFTDAPLGANYEDWGFDTLVNRVIAGRQANPRFNLPTDRATVAAEADQQNAMRMLSVAGGDQFILNDGGGGQTSFPVPPPRGRLSAAGARLGAGVGTLWDWLGAGAQPVAQDKADARAAICAVCPQNRPGDLTSWFTAPAAALIKRQIESRNQMKLSTASDDKLNVCVACSCPLKLKVHVPLADVVGRMSTDTKARLDPACWIINEK